MQVRQNQSYDVLNLIENFSYRAKWFFFSLIKKIDYQGELDFAKNSPSKRLRKSYEILNLLKNFSLRFL